MGGACSLRLFHLKTIGQLGAPKAVNKLFALARVSGTKVLLIIQKIVYSDGVNRAGDDILEHLIYRIVFPNLRRAIQNNDQEDKFEQYFGPSASPAKKHILSIWYQN